MIKKYSKTKLKKFRETIVKRMEEISQDMDDIKESIEELRWYKENYFKL